MVHRITFAAGMAVGYVLGARAGRERYEQIRKGARELAQSPAVRNAAEAAGLGGREAVVRVAAVVTERLPEPLAARLRRGRGDGASADEWGTSNT
ncbi:YtxH domain-containing protein [Streptomyces polyrhachis]|uniref:YtxH domain-containing protein n=1 Tax=Streptomyces polyrhachis TaxID=1282885 RepID=A0ABW2GIJ0_9ACTN